ncbi:MAG: protein kinase [Ignavibacteriaceae bacterium]
MLGLKIGHYRIVDILGEGGMGIVYKALDIKLERYVAIKILSSQAINNPQFVERFKREAKNQAKLNHPNIVPVYGFTEENHILGIVMEYVEGETLEHLIESRGRIPLIEALHILRQILEGSSYAHNKGFVHRDIKPSNIIINNEGVAKIMDFGISKSMNETRGITKTGTKLGTILYMSPEQVKALDPTSQSDIYSTGITFYEMISGKNPFDIGTDYQIMEAHLKMNPPRLSTMIGNVGAEVDDIIARALNKSLRKRYGSCEEFIADIDMLIERLELSGSGSKIKPRAATAKQTLEFKLPAAKESRFSKIKFYLYAFFFIVVFSGLILFIYDAVSGFWKFDNVIEKESQAVLDSYKLNPAYIAKTRWQSVNNPANTQLNAITFIDDNLGFACGLNGTLLKSTDGGANWISLLDTLHQFGKINFYDIYFTSLTEGFLTGDGGTLLSLNPVTDELKKINTVETESLFDIHFIDNSNTGFIIGAGGAILKTDNGGLNWRSIKSPVNTLLYRLFFVGNKTGFIVGWNGTLLYSTDQGESWTLHQRITDKYLKGIYFVSDDIGLVAGGGGEIFRTENSGEDWELIQSEVSSGLSAIHFFDEKSGIILGGKGEILLTEDSGKSWKLTPSGQYAGLTSLTTTPSNKIFLSGQNGIILTSSN